MKPKFVLAVLPILLVAILLFTSAGLAQPETLDPADLAIYYGWPSLVNAANGDVAVAAAVFGEYDIVIFNQGLEEALHGDHAKTKEIIQLLREDYGTQVFGYINGPQWGTSWSVSGIAPATWEAHADMWKAMGVEGIFIDEFGYDWQVTRVMQNAMLDVVHGRGLRAFVNSWFVDHTFSSAPDPIFPAGNPNSVAPKIRATDLYLMESFAIIEGQYDACQRAFFDTWITKSDKAVNYRNTFGTSIWAMTTADKLTTAALSREPQEIDPRLSYAWHAAAMYGLNGFGWTEQQFSASGPAQNLLPWRERPAPNTPVGTGALFQGPVQHTAPLHTRNTDIGQFRVVCNDTPKTHTAEFVVLATATSTPTNTATATSTPTPTNTPTATPTPTTAPCSLEPYDFNDDGAIDIIDISMVSSRWMNPALYDPAFDVAPAGDPDEKIDIADISAVAVRFGQSCP